MFGQTLGVSSPTRKQEISLFWVGSIYKRLQKEEDHINVCPQTVYGVQPPRSPDLIRLDFFFNPWGALKTPRVFNSN